MFLERARFIGPDKHHKQSFLTSWCFCCILPTICILQNLCFIKSLLDVYSSVMCEGIYLTFPRRIQQYYPYWTLIADVPSCMYPRSFFAFYYKFIHLWKTLAACTWEAPGTNYNRRVFCLVKFQKISIQPFVDINCVQNYRKYSTHDILLIQ